MEKKAAPAIYGCMLLFKVDNTNVVPSFVLTLTEKTTLDAPDYKFSFKHTETGKVVEFTKPASDDISQYPERYNEFHIDVNTLFGQQPSGQWLYTIYEVADDVSNEVENGRMDLIKDSETTMKAYDVTTNYKAYEGK